MTDAPSYQDKKKLLRDHARTVRASLSKADIEEKSRLICRRLLEVIEDTDTVMIYASKPLEVNTKSLIGDLISRGKTIVVPIIEKDTKTLRLSYLRDPDVLQESTFQVPEPVGRELPAQASSITAVIIPMLAFDKKGNRLGYGAGYYDRFLSLHPHLTRIGIAFSCQEVEEIPADATDAGMDIIVTDTCIISCR
ncbi:MAG: 5-formyltetrahydrofolate cyclo-ligase [Methanoregula sp.]|jgi:5-formyltetrahydrofolate cyclo-ligase|nr:5-formyltetrahydrofolate cyclo-ligase [Methanoregula sp.]